MPTNAELKKEVDELKEKIDAQFQQVEFLTEKLLSVLNDLPEKKEESVGLQRETKVTKLPEPPEKGGWLITVPNEHYFGKTFGVQFKGGMAIIPLSADDGKEKAKRMLYEFNYNVTAVDEEQVMKNLLYMSGLVEPPETEVFPASTQPLTQAGI